MDALFHALGIISQELLLFSAAGFLMVGTDELVVDLIWCFQKLKRWASAGDVCPCAVPWKADSMRLAIFVPAWREADVIGHMLRNTLNAWTSANYQIFVGCYPNDAETQSSVQAIGDRRIRLVLCDKPGPTTKGDCLNQIWRAMVADEAISGRSYAAIVLHDAEDLVHREELNLYARYLGIAPIIQLPVQPLQDRHSRWVSGHYIDEFAEAHGRDLIVRQAIGAALPLAGVGCAISREAMGAISQSRGGLPFDPASLTEDYELGLILGSIGYRSIFVRQTAKDSRGLVAIRGHFPSSMETAIRQKTRWTLGIALLGWQRLGWRFTFPEMWMRLRDRRTLMSSILLCAAYAGLLIALFCSLIQFAHPTPARESPRILATLFVANLAILIWRAIVRAGFVMQIHGFDEGLRSIPRMLVASFVAIASSTRAVRQYGQVQRTNRVVWDKTSHIFPAEVVD